MFNIKMPFVIATHGKKFTSTTALKNKSKAFALGMVSGVLFAHDGTVVRTILSNAPMVTITGDGAITLTPGVTLLTKGSAAAITIAAPGTAMIGQMLTITTGSDFAHVVTFTGTTLNDGTAGANSTWTAAAVQGSSLTVVGVTATKWNVVSFNLGTIAP